LTVVRARKDAINEAIDFALGEYKRDSQAILAEAERKRELFGARDRRLAQWSKSRGCIFRGCTARSIRRSHSIQKSGPLLAVSKGAVVLTPQLDFRSGEMRLIERGLSQASVFPGFCETHEALFRRFEETKDLKEVENVWLQIYRTICREVVRLEIEVASADGLVADYAGLRDRKLLSIVEQRLGLEWLKRNDVTLNDLQLHNDPVLKPAQETADELRTALAELKSEHLPELESLVPDRLGEAAGPFGFTLDEPLPVTLSGMGFFDVIERGTPRRVLALLGVFPDIDSGSTTLVMHGKAADANAIHAYLRRVQTPLDALGMVERWMVRGTDHWFVDPDLWRAKDTSAQRALLREMLDSSKGITAAVGTSLFDDLRTRLLGELAATMDEETIRRERAKLRNPS